MTCAALEVSCTGADQDFIFADNALAAAPAYAAVRVHNNCAGFHEGVDQTFLQCLEINGLACRNHKETNYFSDLLSFNDGSADSQVLVTSGVAGT